MKLICDTIFWYLAGKGEFSFEDSHTRFDLLATFTNLFELSELERTLKNNHFVRKGLRTLWTQSSDIILLPPLDYLSMLVSPSNTKGFLDRHKVLLNYANLLANDRPTDLRTQTAFGEYIQAVSAQRAAHCKQINNQITVLAHSDSSRKGAKDIRHKKIGSKLLTSLMSGATGPDSFPNDFEWSEIELLEAVLTHVIKRLQLYSTPFVGCDLTSIFQLVYVRPGDKVLIAENCLRTLILESRMKKYLL